jgi:hypothetical protein
MHNLQQVFYYGEVSVRASGTKTFRTPYAATNKNQTHFYELFVTLGLSFSEVGSAEECFY